jgi:TRAP-type mannitol/chloroaromatic compound transport system substrate-binding protein
MATTWDGKSSYISEALRDFENRIEQRTKGQFKITIKNSLEHPTTGVSIKFDSLCNLLTSDQEDLQIIHAGNYYWKDWRGRLPESTFFAAIPFGRDYEKMDDWMGERADEWTDSTKWKMGYRFWHNLYAPYGIVPFPGGNSGRQWGGWYKQPITRIEDYKGKKIRISNVGQMIMEAVGGNTCTLKQYQIKDSMQFGKLDMAEWINCYDDQKMGMDKCGFRYVETEGWAEPSSLFGFFVNEKALNSLEPNIKAILLDEIEHLNSKMKGIFEHRHYDALRTLKEENNTRLPKDKLVFFELPKPVRTVLKDSTKAILSRYVQQRKVGHPTIEAIYKSYIEGCPELK